MLVIFLAMWYKEMEKISICLNDVLVVPEMYCNLISMTKLMERGYEISGKNNEIKVEKRGIFIIFDRKVKSGNGILVGINLVRKKKNNDSVPENAKTKEIVSAHHVLGHPSAIHSVRFYIILNFT